MIAVNIEMTPAEGRADDYFSMAKSLRPDAEQIDGFISVERFESVTTPGKLVSISFWRDEASLRQWRIHDAHGMAQKAGRSGIFDDYRVRIGNISRDYGLTDRAQAPKSLMRPRDQMA
jgi:heme-degrading monooxygenase HmoA